MFHMKHFTETLHLVEYKIINQKQKIFVDFFKKLFIVSAIKTHLL